MSTWSEAAARRDTERQRLANLQLEKDVQDRRVLNTKGDAEWANLRFQIAERCREYNAEPGKAGTFSYSSDAFGCRVCLTGRPRCIVGKFGAATLQFSGVLPLKYEACWHLKLAEDGLGVWWCDRQEFPVALEDIAGVVLDALLECR